VQADLIDPSEREAKVAEILTSLQAFHHDIQRSSLFPLNVKAAAEALKVNIVVPQLSEFNSGFLALLVRGFKRKLLKYHIKAGDVAKKMEILIQGGIKSAKLDRVAKLAMCVKVRLPILQLQGSLRLTWHDRCGCPQALRFLSTAEEQAVNGLKRCLETYESELKKLQGTLTRLLIKAEVRQDIIKHVTDANLGDIDR
jgi:hypothetical protein